MLSPGFEVALGDVEVVNEALLEEVGHQGWVLEFTALHHFQLTLCFLFTAEGVNSQLPPPATLPADCCLDFPAIESYPPELEAKISSVFHKLVFPQGVSTWQQKNNQYRKLLLPEELSFLSRTLGRAP